MMRTGRLGFGNVVALAGALLLLSGVLCRGNGHQAAASSARGGKVPLFEVYAIRYATSPGFSVSSLAVGADPARKVDIPFMFWVLKGAGHRNILVDAGSYRGPSFDKWKLAGFIKPSIAIGKVGLAPDDITDVIITHIHWDHVGGVSLFPKARVWIQREEFEHYIDAQGKPRSDAINPDDSAMLADLRRSGQLKLVDGDAREIIPGIKVYTGGKHTYACQFVGVATASGTVVVASDNIYLYENLEKHLPLGLTEDRDADLRNQTRMLSLASSPRLIIPGHDPDVFERFPKPGDGVAKIE
ncbi:MAG TPA: N-acyl homoserine lactonase family protein [Acidobacteriota bacterium]|nr:N-acyl homoserine lactonase family protein [Acidobacteriota bacterium]